MDPQVIIKQFGIALTGGIASGKSSLAQLLQRFGLPCIDADVLSRKAVVPGSSGLKALVTLMGPGILMEAGSLNRKALRDRIFLDPHLKEQVESIIHPEIARLLVEWLEEEGLLQNPRLWVYEASLIFEKSREKDFREIWVSACSHETQLARLMARDHLTEEQARLAIHAQMPVDLKKKRADFVIDTEAPLPEVISQIQIKIARLQASPCK